jgi:hypothetical protein
MLLLKQIVVDWVKAPKCDEFPVPVDKSCRVPSPHPFGMYESVPEPELVNGLDISFPSIFSNPVTGSAGFL